MNYLELINRCLLELNYKQVNAFSELIKNDHKRIKIILNIINKEICCSEAWNFLLRKVFLDLPAGINEITNTVPGRILYLFIDGKRYDYCENLEKYISGMTKPESYAVFNEKLLLPKFSTDKRIQIVYYTQNCVFDSEGIEKLDLEYENDSSLIPMPFSEQLLVYGTCLRLKANPQYFKFSYWLSMYNEALANLKSKTCVNAQNAPVINVYRN